MIRIDEIYCNTFLPLMQTSWQGIHYFDPFGSVKFQDLCSQPPIPWDDRARRYLFVDQEPLHTDLIDQMLIQFKEMYNGTHHIITSEYASEYVEHIQNTYGFIPHYYFFHGWAALDWFRGYNRSFLMPEPKNRTITKTFLAPNRIIAGERNHRLIMLYHIFKSNITNNHISCPRICPAENIDIMTAIKSLVPAYPDIEDVFLKQNFPLKFVNEQNAPMHSYQLSLFKEASESLLYLVTETVATGRRNHLTEKTFKPICLRMPFIIVGTQGSLKYLKKYGFRTFDHLWDETYDDEINDHQRMEKIAFTLRALDILPKKEQQKLFELAQEVCEYNYNHFYSGNFEKILWQELQEMINEF